MQFITTITIQATPQQIWNALFNPQLLGDCMPGLTEWQEIEPQRVYRLLMAWGATTNSLGIQVPVMVQWGKATILEQIAWEADLLLGSQPIHLWGNVGMKPQENGVYVELETRLEAPSPALRQMASNVAPKILQPFLKCLRRRLEGRDADEE